MGRFSGLPFRACAACAVIGGVLLPAGSALAEVPPPDPGLEAQRAQDLQQRRDALETFRPAAALPTETEAPQVAGGPCFRIGDIVVEGAHAVPAESISAIVSPSIGRCLEGADIQNLMRGIDALYAERGFITSRTYLPAQNIAAGQLRLQVVEGSVAKITQVDAAGKPIAGYRARAELVTAFPGAEGRIFQLRDFEQGLDQMNRLKSVKATMRLVPGAEPGQSDVLVARQETDPLRATVSFDNTGARSTGRNRMVVEVQADNPLGLNDTWSLNYTGTQNTNALGFSGSVPWGSWTFGVSRSYSEYDLPLTLTSELYGRSEKDALTATRMLHRDQVSTTSLELEFATDHTDRFVNGAQLTPQDVTTLRAGLRHIRQIGESRWSFDGGLTLGLDGAGATEDPGDIRRDEAHAQFALLEGGIFRVAPLSSWGSLQNDLRLQYAPVSLYPSQQMYLGSQTTVRGYDGSVAAGDAGVTLRNDLLVDPGIFVPKETRAPSWIGGAQASGFFDMGSVYDQSLDRWSAAAGIGIGLGYSTKRAAAKLSVALPLVGDNRLRAGSPLLQFNLTVKAF